MKKIVFIVTLATFSLLTNHVYAKNCSNSLTAELKVSLEDLDDIEDRWTKNKLDLSPTWPPLSMAQFKREAKPLRGQWILSSFAPANGDHPSKMKEYIQGILDQALTSIELYIKQNKEYGLQLFIQYKVGQSKTPRLAGTEWGHRSFYYRDVSHDSPDSHDAVYFELEGSSGNRDLLFDIRYDTTTDQLLIKHFTVLSGDIAYFVYDRVNRRENTSLQLK